MIPELAWKTTEIVFSESGFWQQASDPQRIGGVRQLAGKNMPAVDHGQVHRLLQVAEGLSILAFTSCRTCSSSAEQLGQEE